MVNLAEDANGDKVANVVVEDKMLSLAIGKEGQNARLAAKLTGWRIDIKSETQVREEAARREQAEADRLAAMTPEEIETERVAQEAAVEIASFAEEETQIAPAETPAAEEEVAAQAVEAQPEAEVAQATAEEETPAVEEPTAEPAAEQAPVEEAQPEEEGEAVPGTEMTFAQAWEEFEAEEESVEGETPEEALKRKADRRKRQTLVFDEKLGKVVAKRKRKGGRARDDWEADIEE
jgi:transcription termination/antitermination protein NusA